MDIEHMSVALVETRFKLTDARDSCEAYRVLTEVLHKQWRNNMAMCPKVEVL